MSWDEVCQTFEGAYFSWDPANFPHQLPFHGYVRTILHHSLPTDRYHLSESGHERMMVLQMDTVRCITRSSHSPSRSTLISCPACHYHLRIKFPNTPPPAKEVDQKLWVLLTRHVTDTKKDSDYIALRVESEFDRRISQQKIDQIAEAVSATGLIPACLYLSALGDVS